MAIVYLPEEQSDADETERAVEREGRRALLIPGDVTRPEFCRRAVERTVKTFGRLDVLVNNAAFQQHQKSIEDITDEQLERTFRTNIFGYFYMVRAAASAPEERQRHHQHRLDHRPRRQRRTCSTTAPPRAPSMRSRIARAESGREKSASTASLAGPVWTPLNPSDKSARKGHDFGADTPMKRPAQPEEVAPAFVFFASNADSSYITGEVLTLLGGDTTAG